MKVPADLEARVREAAKRKKGLSWLVILPFLGQILQLLLPLILDWFDQKDDSAKMAMLTTAALEAKDL